MTDVPIPSSTAATVAMTTLAVSASDAIWVNYSPAWAGGDGYFDGLEAVKSNDLQVILSEDPDGRRIVGIQCPWGTVVFFQFSLSEAQVAACLGNASRPLREILRDYVPMGQGTWTKYPNEEFSRWESCKQLSIGDDGDIQYLLKLFKEVKEALSRATKDHKKM